MAHTRAWLRIVLKSSKSLFVYSEWDPMQVVIQACDGETVWQAGSRMESFTALAVSPASVDKTDLLRKVKAALGGEQCNLYETTAECSADGCTLAVKICPESGVKIRLCTIKLLPTATTAGELFDRLATQMAATQKRERELRAQRDNLRAMQAQLAELCAELPARRRRQQDALLERFVHDLNARKKRIRRVETNTTAEAEEEFTLHLSDDETDHETVHPSSEGEPEDDFASPHASPARRPPRAPAMTRVTSLTYAPAATGTPASAGSASGASAPEPSPAIPRRPALRRAAGGSSGEM
eukprot:m.68717 g.68717  ORF g.68717 m.68717 type:complete len:297 (-) comp7514_c0_seq2:185-1075(-)